MSNSLTHNFKSRDVSASKNDPLIQPIMKILPGANFGDEKDEEEDDAKAVEPPGHPPSNHSLFINDDRS